MYKPYFVMKENKSLWSYHNLIMALLAINVLLTAFLIIRKDPAVKLEELKAWGIENFSMVQELYNSDSYKLQQKATISQFLDSIKWEDNLAWEQQENNELNLDDGAVNQEMIDKLNEIKKSWYIQWDENAQITVLEYSELVCPFCKRQKEQWTIKQVLEKYPGKVNSIFRQFPIVSLHPTAPKWAEAMECAWEIGGKDAFYQYEEKAFLLNELSDDNLINLAKEMGLDQNKFWQCLQSWKYKEKVDNQIAEWQLFGVSWTPWNVVINSANWKFELIAWAYPVEKFVEVIDKMLSQ